MPSTLSTPASGGGVCMNENYGYLIDFKKLFNFLNQSYKTMRMTYLKKFNVRLEIVFKMQYYETIFFNITKLFLKLTVNSGGMRKVDNCVFTVILIL